MPPESPLQRYLQGTLFGEQLKDAKRQRKWEDLRQELLSEQIEDIRQERKQKNKLFALLKDYPELQKAQGLAEAGVPKDIAYDVAGYLSPEQKAEKERTQITGGLADIQAQPGGEYTLKEVFEDAPPEIKAKMVPLARMFPGMMPEEVKAPTPLKPTATARNLAAKKERFEKWYSGQPPHFGLVPEEEIEGAFLGREFKGKEAEATRTPALVNSYLSYLKTRGIPTDELSFDEWYRQMGIGKRIGGDESPPTVELPPALITELGKFESFEDWYDSLPEEKQSKLEPEEEKAVRAWYGTF